jgi:protein-arginine kinase activator protein McsA
VVIGSSSTNIYRVVWCNFCNQRPSAGKVTVVHEDDPAPVQLDACQSCAKKLLDTESHD